MEVVASTPPGGNATPARGYTASEAARWLEISVGEVHSWVRAGVIEPRRGPRHEYRFSFQDLVVVRAARALASELPARRVKRALRRLRAQLPHGRGLAGVRLAVEGEDIVVRDGAVAWEPESGQAVLDFGAPRLVPGIPALPARAAPAPGVSREADAESWFELGCELESESAAQARDAYRRALELDPDHFDARVNLGRLLHESSEFAAAEANYRLALRTRPGDATASFNLGVVLEDLTRPAEALAAYEQAIGTDPRYADAHYNLSQLHERLRHPAQALRHLQTYRALIEEGGA
jgi:tetratricopeptide (TPR) repeat protein